ncbi:hypothetical protein [Bdellovibrio sp. HCB2-146]|uniref:hypothetical protein n=1 Tax=Bdellovibrio sp. HCB2-146 TaxID=3394362 RepID=UPI0039BD7025
MKVWSGLLIFVFILMGVQTHAAPSLKIEMDQSVLSDLNKDSFAKVLRFVYSRGVKEITFVKNSSYSLKVGTTALDENYAGGDAFIMHGLAPEQDKQMRQDEYRALFPIVDYLSRRRMRVTVNLHAGTADLRTVLQNIRPTVIIWSSHGNDEFFYGSNGEAIPHGIFKNASPSVYQFILSACYGRLAMDNFYLKDLPPGNDMLTVGWSGLTNSGEMMSYLMSDRWDMYERRPDFTNQGLTCKDKEMIRVADGARIFDYADRSSCGSAVIQARENMACISVSDKKSVISSISHNLVLPADSFDNFFECADRLSRAFNKKLCLRNGTEIRIVDSVSAQAGEQVFKSMRDCEQSLITEVAL